ncbi:MAG: hypothetical protein NZM13_00045 [Cyclobacteriaceae bacterium]|nr:hypothetical protein [Cyclobacteriaceae bacterium]
MKRTRFTEAQIINILREFDAGKSIQDITWEQGCPKPPFTNGRPGIGHGAERAEARQGTAGRKPEAQANVCRIRSAQQDASRCFAKSSGIVQALPVTVITMNKFSNLELS